MDAIQSTKASSKSSSSSPPPLEELQPEVIDVDEQDTKMPAEEKTAGGVDVFEFLGKAAPVVRKVFGKEDRTNNNQEEKETEEEFPLVFDTNSRQKENETEEDSIVHSKPLSAAVTTPLPTGNPADVFVTSSSSSNDMPSLSSTSVHYSKTTQEGLKRLRESLEINSAPAGGDFYSLGLDSELSGNACERSWTNAICAWAIRTMSPGSSGRSP